MSLVSHDSVDHRHLSYAPPEKQGQVYYSKISYKDQPFLLVTPCLVSLEKGPEVVTKSTTNLHLEMRDNEFSFHDCMVRLDDRNIKETCSRSKEWFQKDIPLELIDDMYKRSHKPIQKGQKPRFQCKLPCLKGVPQCKIFDKHKTLLPIEALQEGTEVDLVLHIKGLKFLKQHYYCDYYISQMRVRTTEESAYHIPSTCLLSDDEDTEDILDGEILETIERSSKEWVEKETELRAKIQGSEEAQISLQKQWQEASDTLSRLSQKKEVAEEEHRSLLRELESLLEAKKE